MLDALGVVAYSTVRQVKVPLGHNVDKRSASGIERPEVHKYANVPNQDASKIAIAGQSRPLADDGDVPTSGPVLAAPIPNQRLATATQRLPGKLPIARAPSVRSELVLPSAEIGRFLESRMYSHFCLLLAQGEAIPVVENAVTSDTALHFELPPKTPLKLGSMALLRSAWRAKRQAWLAIRLWRKQQR